MTLHLACERLAEVADLHRFCDCNEIAPGLTNDQLNDILDNASDALVRLTRLRLGRCEVAVRPCRPACQPQACGCCQLRGIRIEGVDPEVVSVRIDGAIVDPSTYAIITSPDGGQYLERFRLDGRPDRWPGCQPLGLAATEVGTFEIVYRVGIHIDMFIRNATAEIACDILSTMPRDTSRELPDGTVGVDGYGMRMDFRNRDGDELEDERFRGLTWVQRLMGIHQQPAGSTVWSPEIADDYDLFVR